MLTHDIKSAMLDTLSGAGLLVECIESDGKIHRTPTADKPKGKDGALVVPMHEESDRLVSL